MRLVTIAVALAMIGCADATTGDAGAPPVERYGGNGTVLQSPAAAAELCLGAVAESLPPQCSGIPITNWDWDSVANEELASGVTWGSYHVVGTYDGRSFTVLEVDDPAATPDDSGVRFAAPCPEPEGGWVATDPTRVSDDDRQAAVRAAESEPDHAATWIDDLDPLRDSESGRYVLVLAFTGDLDAHREDIDRLWGGPLCVWEFGRTFRELRSIQSQLGEIAHELGIEMLWSSIDVSRNQVELGVVITAPELEATLASRFGAGAVRIEPALVAVG